MQQQNESETRPPFLQWLLFHVLPAIALLIIGGATIIAIAALLRHKPETVPPKKVVPVVEAIEAQPARTRSIVDSQGVVQSRTETTLVAEVSGRVVSISPDLYAGGFFKQDDTLATIEKTDYIAAVASAKSRYAEAKVAYEQEFALAEQAQEDWRSMGADGQPSELVLRKPQLARAQATLEAAQAAVDTAERDLSRTEIKAPYAGRVQHKFIDVGQFVNARTSQIASIYAIDTAEIRLPLSLADTRLIDIPERFSDGSSSGSKPKVVITARYGGKAFHWEGVIDRSEGAVDPQTRLLYLVAQIKDPYAADATSDRPPLKVGSFVTAQIFGQTIEKAFTLPRRALREGDTLFVINEDRTLEIREVDPYQKTSQNVILVEGLEKGELVCLTPLQYVVDGMNVLVEGDPVSSDEEGERPSVGNE